MSTAGAAIAAVGAATTAAASESEASKSASEHPNSDRERPVVSEPITARRAAKVAGAGYVVLFIAAIFANFFVREQLVDASDAGLTASNIAESEGLFRLGLVAFLVIFALDVVIAWALHIVLRERHHDLSLLAAWLRLTYTVLLGVAIIFLYQALSLLGGAGFLTAIPTDQLHAQALVALDQFNATWLIGLLVFGLHLITVGWVLIKTRLAPQLLGLIMIVAGVAYVADTLFYSLLSNYGDYESAFLAMVAIPSMIGEGWFGLWLLLRAGSKAQSS